MKAETRKVAVCFFSGPSWLAFKSGLEKLPVDWVGGNMNKANEIMNGLNQKIMNHGSY